VYGTKGIFAPISSRRTSQRAGVFPQRLGSFSRPARGGATLARILAPILLVTIFWVDTTAPESVDVPALYVAPALLFIRTGRFWEPLLVAIAATALTAVAGTAPPAAAGAEPAGLRWLVQVLVIWLSAGTVAYHRRASDRWATQIAQEQDSLRGTISRLEELRHALDAAAIVAVTDQRGIITEVNDKFCEISQYSRAELLGQDHRVVNSGYHPAEFMRELWRTIARGRVWRGEICNRAKDGSFYWVDTTIVPFCDGRGKPRQYLAIRSEITQRKAAEARLADQAALAQLGELAAVVAHEVRNPLAGLRGTLEVLRPRLGDGRPERDVVQAMIDRIDVLNAKVSDILRFARPQAPVLGAVDLEPLCREAVQSARAAIGAAAPELVVAVQPVAVQGDAEMLRAALLNLLLNACQSGADRVELTAAGSDGECRIAVRDNGTGIPQDVAARVFEAFYTTKKSGTGLGLPIVKRLTELQGGRVSIKPRDGGGTVAELTFPLHLERAADARPTLASA
jgi:PAS domain S-box-containing protein